MPSYRERVSTFFSVLYLSIYLFFLRLATTCYQNILYKSSPAFRKATRAGTILLIGDGLAEGVGDGLVQGGLSRRVTRLLTKHASDTNLRFIWEAVTAGRLHSTSVDWLPAAGAVADDDKSLFRAALVTGPFARAKVVVILLGLHDSLGDGAETAANIAATACAAARLGKHVLVGTAPGFDEAGTDEYLLARTRNLMIAEAVEALPKVFDGGGSVTMGPDVQRVLVRGGDVVEVEHDFMTLNKLGYRTYAREVHDEVAPLLKRVEWAYWREVL